MSENFITSNKLATLDELRYLLLDVLDRREPMSWKELNTLCKEHSFNFLYAFENTIGFLSLLEVVKINDDSAVSRNFVDGIELKTEQELTTLVIQKTFSWLEKAGFLKEIINHNILTNDAAKDRVMINTSKLAAKFPFFKVLLLNLKIAEPSRNSNDQLLIFKEYRSLFTDKLGIITVAKKPGEKSEKKHNVFISYSHKDEMYKEELRKHLRGIVRKDSIEEWNGRAIDAGADWDDEVKQKLEQADVVLFLVSADFMDSDYIHDVEISKTIERHKQGLVRIIPVNVRRCDVTSLPIGKYQALPTGGLPISEWTDKDAAYYDVVTQIKKTLKIK